jgi:hypothetical protein
MKLRCKVANIFAQPIQRTVVAKDQNGSVTSTGPQIVNLVTVQLVPVPNADSADNAAVFDSDGVGWITLQPMMQTAAAPFKVGQIYELTFAPAA